MSFAGTPGAGVPPPGSMFTSEMLAQKVRARGAVCSESGCQQVPTSAGACLRPSAALAWRTQWIGRRQGGSRADRAPSPSRPLQAAEKQRELKDRLREFFEEKGERPGVKRGVPVQPPPAPAASLCL